MTMITKELQRLLDGLVKLKMVNAGVLQSKRSILDDSIALNGIAKSLVSVLGFSETDTLKAICTIFNLPTMTIAGEMETAPANILSDDEVFQYRVLPVFQIGLELTVAFVDPPSESLRILLQKISGFRVVPVMTTISDFAAASKRYKGALDKLQSLGSVIDLTKFDIRKSDGKTNVSENIDDHNVTVAQLMDELLLRAAKSGASDVHVEPGENELMIRFRIDGELQRIVSLPMSYHSGLVAVMKERSGIDMFERMVPQDGRMTLKFANRVLDVRVSTLPLLYGEKIVLRLLGKSAMMANLENIGFSEVNLKLFRALLALPNGIVLVTGPTGSGKTTSLYAGLNEIKGIALNITTVENPVEYKLELVNQVQVESERGVTFATALRSILRQDPDVVLVGEIRDAETGTVATEAALTGHLVLSTLHTNDAIGAIPRMINLGIESFWVSSSVIGIVAQRLVRKICTRCKEEYEPDLQTLENAGLLNLPKGTTLFRGRGCAFCNGIGYKGRIAIHEVLVITEEMRDAIVGEVTTSKIRSLAIANHFRDMYFDGVQKALAGITSLEEVQRITKKM
jgi:type IV pilus assembly protein PilB